MMQDKWQHSSGETDDGLCLACIEEFSPNDVPSMFDATFKWHRVKPDPDSDRNDPYCWVCGHNVERKEDHQ